MLRLPSDECRRCSSVHVPKSVRTNSFALFTPVLELLLIQCDETPCNECVPGHTGQSRGVGFVQFIFSLLFSVENPIGWKGVAILAESVLRGNHLRALRVLILHCLFT